MRHAQFAATAIMSAIFPNARTAHRPVRQSRPGLVLLAAALTITSAAGAAIAAGPTHKYLFSFTNLRGTGPEGGVIADTAGNLYGTTDFGGKSNDGVVFKLSPPALGQTAWTEKVLHAFSGTDGVHPYAGLVADSAGNLYGTTHDGGAAGIGLVFELSPPAAGKTAWRETVLHSFNGADGDNPGAGLIADSAGNLYGTTDFGGKSGDGVVFELSPPAAGQTAWTETVLHAFNRADGYAPVAGLIADSAGNLYGTTLFGGGGNCPNGCGTVFELSPPAAGQTAWTETVLHAFDGTDGELPYAGVIADSAGNLFGTTAYGGPLHNDGVVFELSPPGAGRTAWTETVLFAFHGTGGQFVAAGLIADSARNLYGMAGEGGRADDGVVFKLSPPAAGQTAWTKTVLHSFNGADGGDPLAALIADGAGNLYGTAYRGGAHDAGVVFELTNTGFTPPRQ